MQYKHHQYIDAYRGNDPGEPNQASEIIYNGTLDCASDIDYPDNNLGVEYDASSFINMIFDIITFPSRTYIRNS